MFYKIDPKRPREVFDLASEGFQAKDRVWVHLKGDFQPTPEGSTATDTFQNTAFEIGPKSFFANAPTTITAPDTTLVAINRDQPLGDNTDPDNDYGVRVKLKPFTSGDDVFRFDVRTELPEVQGSIYKAGRGDDVVVMPDAPVQGFDTDKLFKAGIGDDRVRAGDLDLKVDFGAGTDTFVLDGATVGWGNKENRDRDGKILIKADGNKYQVSNAEILKDGDQKDLLVKWYFGIARDDDGGATIRFFENGKLVAEGDGFHDEALPAPNGKYEASFHKGGSLGERIEFSGVPGFGDVLIRKGADGGNAETDIVTSRAFLNSVFDHIEDAYGMIGRAVPWKQGAFTPLVPVTVAVGGTVDQPVVRAKDITTDDTGNSVVTPRFKLQNAGDVPGLEYKSVQIFFKMEGRAEKGEDWNFAGKTKAYNGRNDFADAVLRHGADDDGDMIYSVMLERGAKSVTVPIRILGDNAQEGNERLKLAVVDIDLWKHKGSGPELYGLSGGPNADTERDFDGPSGLENRLLPDTDVFVKILDDDLMS